MDSKMSFAEHLDIAVGKALAMLGFVKRISSEFRDPLCVNCTPKARIRKFCVGTFLLRAYQQI
jgi:hypothetical protein